MKNGYMLSGQLEARKKENITPGESQWFFNHMDHILKNLIQILTKNINEIRIM